MLIVGIILLKTGKNTFWIFILCLLNYHNFCSHRRPLVHQVLGGCWQGARHQRHIRWWRPTMELLLTRTCQSLTQGLAQFCTIWVGLLVVGVEAKRSSMNKCQGCLFCTSKIRKSPPAWAEKNKLVLKSRINYHRKWQIQLGNLHFQ